MNCKNYVDIEFSTFVPVNSWMNITEENMNTIQLCISVNTDNLKVNRTQEVYDNNGAGVEVDHPCGEGTITLDSVMIDVAKLSGYIGYVVGGVFLVTSDNVEIGIDENNNPIKICNIATESDICHLDEVDFLVLDPSDVDPLDLVVTVVEADIESIIPNDTNDQQFLVVGKFRISRKPVTP